MSPIRTLARWLDIREPEYRPFTVSAAGAFLVISFVVVARSLREAFFLDEFTVQQLPYITIATAVLSLPLVGAFSRLLARREPRSVLQQLILVTAAGLAVLWAITTFSSAGILIALCTVVFYLWTVLASLLITSGFWIVTSERFVLRDAKRLFGMIGAAGTLGAMVAGISLRVVTAQVGNGGAVLGLVVTLALLYRLLGALPAPAHTHRDDTSSDATSSDATVRENLTLLLGDRHLRTIALIIAVATAASFMIDYQFKEAASLHFATDEEMAGFLGTFYGLAGVVSLGLQVLVASRLLASSGVAWTLSVLPFVLLIGSTSLLLAPGLLAAAFARGADNSIRKSTHRTVIEYLYVPVPAQLRRRTKTFVDSFVDSAAEGFAALVVVVWVTALGLPSRGLSFFAIGLALGLFLLARLMGTQYFESLLLRLQEGQNEIAEDLVQTHFGTDDLGFTVTQLDMSTLMSQLPDATGDSTASGYPPPTLPPDPATMGTMERLTSPDPLVVSDALDQVAGWSARHVQALVRLLARDVFERRVTRILAAIGSGAVLPLTETLHAEDADFVIRRRIPKVLAEIDDPAAETGLLAGLSTRRFEVRYRCGVALARRSKNRGLEVADARRQIWEAITGELNRERPIWELQQLLDARPGSDELVADKVYGRGELSLEHTFRLLSLVLDPEPIRTAFHGIVLSDDKLKSISLEYLEQVLPEDVRDHLWPFIGDISDFQREQQSRGMDEVVADLLRTGATLFVGETERAKLREALDQDDADS